MTRANAAVALGINSGRRRNPNAECGVQSGVSVLPDGEMARQENKFFFSGLNDRVPCFDSCDCRMSGTCPAVVRCQNLRHDDPEIVSISRIIIVVLLFS